MAKKIKQKRSIKKRITSATNPKKPLNSRLPRRSAGRPVESSGLNLRQKILDAYFDICRHDGIESVTLQKLADRSGVALTTVRYHFQMQGVSLSQVATDYMSDKTYEYLDQGMLHAREGKNFDPVRAYIHVTFRWIEEQPVQASFLIYYYYLSSTQVEQRVTNKELIEIAHRRIQGLIHEGLGMKLYRHEGDTLKLSRQIHLIITGACMYAITARDSEFIQTHKDLCLELTMKLLGAQNF